MAKPIYPIPVPKSVSIDVVKGMRQGSENACSVYGCCHAWQVKRAFAGLSTEIDPIEIYTQVLLEKYDGYYPNKSVSVPETLRKMRELGYIRTWRSMPTTPEEFTIKIYQIYPVITVLHTTSRLHVVCVLEYDENEFKAIDSQSRHRLTVTDFSTLEASYILFL